MLWTLLAALLMLLFPLRVQWVQQPKKIPSSFPLAVIVLPEAPAVSTWAEPARKARVLLFCSFPKGAWYFLAKPNAEFLRGGCWRRILALWLQNLKGDKLVFRLLWQRHNQNMIYSHTWPLPRHKRDNEIMRYRFVPQGLPWCVAAFEAGDLNSGRLGKELQVKQIPLDCSNLEPNPGAALIFHLKSLWNHLKEGNKRQTPEKISSVTFCTPQFLQCAFNYQFNYFCFQFFFHFYIGCTGNSCRLWMLPSASYLNKDSNNNTSNLWTFHC